jgi:predicted ester cyclase
MKSEFGAFPDMKLAATRMFANDDVVVEEWTCTGTNTGAGFGPPTGKAFGMNGASVFVLDADGQIKEEHEFADAPTVLAQLGMSKAPARPVIALPAVPPEVHVAKGTSDEARDADIARAISRAIAAYDESAFAAVYSDNVSWDDLTQLAPTSGKSARVDALRSMKAAFRSPKLDCSFWSFDGFVAQECALTAQSTGARLVGTAKLSANHKTVALHELDIIMVKDGKVVSGRGYGNRMELAAQLAPPKPEAKKVVPKDASKQPSR